METEGDFEHIHSKAEGQSPSANLTKEGYMQSEKLSEFLYDKNIDSIISSPFVRALQSITPLSEKMQLKVTTDDRLSERILCSEEHPNWREMLRDTFFDLELSYNGGESSSAAMNRALSVITQIKNNGLKNAAMVTHGNLMSLLLKYYDNDFGFEEWERLTNPDVYQLQLENLPAIFRRVWID
jgi:2,3-bisphosphoglycerate-dependent phosphoglycerate mutase